MEKISRIENLKQQIFIDEVCIKMVFSFKA